MNLALQASTILLLPLALALPTPEVPEAVEEPSVPVPVTEEASISAPADACQQLCPPEWSPICAKDSDNHIVIFSNQCLFNNANCDKHRYILGRMEEYSEAGENTPILPMFPSAFKG